MVETDSEVNIENRVETDDEKRVIEYDDKQKETDDEKGRVEHDEKKTEIDDKLEKKKEVPRLIKKVFHTILQ